MTAWPASTVGDRAPKAVWSRRLAANSQPVA